MAAKVGLHGVQGLAPARGKRRNACAGKEMNHAERQPETVDGVFRLPMFARDG